MSESDTILIDRRFEIHRTVSPDGYPEFVLYVYVSSMFHAGFKEMARNADRSVLEAAITFLEGKDDQA